MSLLHQTLDGASHRDNVVIRMRREDEHPFGIGIRTLRAIRVVSVWFTARPACDGMLEVVEYLDVAIVGRAVESQKLREPVLVIILVGQLQQGLLGDSAKPNQCGTSQLVVPSAAGDQPGTDDAGKLAGTRQVEHHVRIVVGLQETGRNGVRDGSLDGLPDDAGFLLSPSGKENLAGRKDVQFPT